jgi:aryl-alcohol dehydrogenase-like predicted oxidoreductase
MNIPKLPIGLGMAAIGRPQYINLRQEAVAESSLESFQQNGFEVLNTAYDQGIRYFDTAPGYGMAEQLLIKWIQKKDDVNIEIATKWGYTYTANFDPNAIRHEIKEHSLKKLNEQWEQSKNLLPFLTTYQIHSATLESGVLDNPDVLKRLYEMKESHRLRIGVTTTGINQTEVLKKALAIQVEQQPLFDTFQVTYNILDQSIATVLHELGQRNNRIIIKEALANGRLFPNSHYPRYEKLYKTLRKMAKKYAVGIDAIGLRFCLDSVSPFVVLSGASRPGHLSDNLKAVDFTLEALDLEALKSYRISPADYWAERKNLGWN